MNRRPQAVVIGESEADATQLALAESVGGLLARLGMTVITGGRGGIMEAASRGAVRAGGIAVAVLPTTGLDDANPWCSIVLPTGLGHGRNIITALAGDVVVVIGGGAGTLSELAFAWMHGRPIFACTGSGGCADLAAQRPPDHRASSTITACTDVAGLETAIRAHCAARGLCVTGPAPARRP